MNAMLRKNFRLVNFPITWIFMFLAVLLFVPEYPYFMTFLYQLLALYFVFQGVRENHDVDFSLMLPVRKGDIAMGYMKMTWVIQVIQVLVCLPVLAIRYRVNPVRNVVGTEANLALLGLALAMFGIFNLIFFPLFLKTASRLAIPAILATSAATLFVVVVEVLAHLGGPVGTVLNAVELEHFGLQLLVLVAGIAWFCLANFLTARLAVARFERADL